MTDDILQMWSKRGKSSPFAVAKFGRSLKVSIEKLNNPFILLSNFVHNESLNVKTCRGWKIEHCRQYIITLCLRIQSSRVLISISINYRSWLQSVPISEMDTWDKNDIASLNSQHFTLYNFSSDDKMTLCDHLCDDENDISYNSRNHNILLFACMVLWLGDGLLMLEALF